MRFLSTVKQLLLFIGALLLPWLAYAQSDYYLFESGHVRPLALSPDGTQLYAVNTPDNRLEIFAVSDEGLTHTASVPVGMEPVAVAVESATRVWVVNHLSDSVSVIDVSQNPATVIATLLVGDEPRDIVFAGSTDKRAFISTARRGQHRTDASLSSVPGAGDPQLTTEGVGRADVWVFDTDALGTDIAVGGSPAKILTFFADTPRALAASPDGQTVYVAAFKSGNQTTAIEESVVCDGFALSGGTNCPSGSPGGVAGPSTNSVANGAVSAPETGIIVKLNNTNNEWQDTAGRNWSSFVNFNLPDNDVFSIDADSLSSASVNAYQGVGTILFNMLVNPVSGKLYVTNTESPNHIRFEGSGDHGGSTVQGQLSKTRITVIDPVTSSVSPKHLNQHIDYSKLHTADNAQIDADILAMKPHSLATPLQLVSNSAGTTLYMAAFGSSKIGVFNTADIEDNNFATNFDPTSASANYLDTAGGPSGLVLDEARNKLYVMQRFDHSIAQIDLSSGATLASHSIPDPEPASVTQGRPFLYDAQLSSGNGEASCASCHIFGDMDDLGWNLGDPDGAMGVNNQPFPPNPFNPPSVPFHPMKGPMTTQTLRGMATHGGMHWRGDRVDGVFGTDLCNQTIASACDEDLSFRNFIVAFEGLLGKDGTIATGDMQLFTDFVLQLMMPPNPVANLDNSFTTPQANGSALYIGPITDTVATCNGCHTLNPANGFFGSGGEQTFDAEPQLFKVPHLRNMYQKVGMFGRSASGPDMGDQIRGFGFAHDGSISTLQQFLAAGVFDLDAQEELDMEQFMLAFPSDLAPIVGQQVTLNDVNAAVANPRIDLLRARAQSSFTSLLLGGASTECELVVKGKVGGKLRGWLMLSNGSYNDDIGGNLSDSQLRNLATTESPLTFTCMVPGSGQRTALDRDRDTVLDGLDNCAAIANLNQLNFDLDAQGDECDSDDDNDLLPDHEEATYGTSQFNPDTDGDGFSDGEEVAAGSDPAQASSTPVTDVNIPAIPLLGAIALFITLVVISCQYRLPRLIKRIANHK